MANSQEKLSAIFELNDQYTKKLNTILASTDKADQKIEKLSNSTKGLEGHLENMGSRGGKAMDLLNSKLLKIVGTGYLLKKSFDTMLDGIKLSATQDIQETTFQALLNNDKAGTIMYRYLSDYAKNSMLGREDLAKGTMSFLSVTQNLEQMEKLYKLTERLYAKDPTQGASGAVFALKELMAGDVISARERFGITGLSGETLRGLVGAGDTDGLIDYISDAMDKFGAAQQVVDRNSNNILMQWDMVTSNIKTSFGEAMGASTDALTPVVGKLKEFEDAGNLVPIISAVGSVTYLFAIAVGFVSDNINWLLPLLGAGATAWATYSIMTGIASVATLLFGLTISPIIIGVLTAAAAVLVLVGGMAKLNSVIGATKSKLGDFKNSTADLDYLNDALGLKNGVMDVNVANTDPITTKGVVEIEDDNIKYFYDLAEQRRAMQYAQPVNYFTFSGDVVGVNDFDEFYSEATARLRSKREAAPAGVYA